MPVKIIQRKKNLTIKIPVKKNPYVYLPIIAALIPWVPLLTYVVHKTAVNVSFLKYEWLLVLLTIIAGGTVGVTFLVWMLLGNEAIIVNKEEIEIDKPLVFYVRKNNYPAMDVTNIHIDKELYRKKISSEWQDHSRTIIRFDTPQKNVTFARGVEPQDAEAILVALAASNYFRPKQFLTVHKS